MSVELWLKRKIEKGRKSVIFSPPFGIWHDIEIDSKFGSFKFNKKKKYKTKKSRINITVDSPGYEDEIDYSENIDEYIGRIYIWPYRIRWYFFSFGFLVYILPLISCFNSLMWWIEIVGFIMVSIISPFAIFYLGRKSVLVSFTGKCGAENGKKFRGVPLFETIKDKRGIPNCKWYCTWTLHLLRWFCRLKRLIKIFLHFLPIFHRTRGAIFWSNGGSIQKALIKMATSDSFNGGNGREEKFPPECCSKSLYEISRENKDEKVSENGNKDRESIYSESDNAIEKNGFSLFNPTEIIGVKEAYFTQKMIHFLFLNWATPVIVSYIYLVIQCVLYAFYENDMDGHKIILSILIWFLLSVIFFLFESRSLAEWVNYTPQDAEYAYPFFSIHYLGEVEMAYRLRDLQFQKLFALCQSLGAGALLLFIQIVKTID